MQDKSDLTIKQKRFCEYYIELSNATEAAIKAGYNVKGKDGLTDRNLAHSIAAENLRKPTISKYLNDRLEDLGFNNELITKQHLFLINQFDNLAVKAKAIDMYYKLTGKYAALKVEDNYSRELNEALDRLSAILPK